MVAYQAHQNITDAAFPWQLGFQDAASPVMEGIINLHHDLMVFIFFIFFFVLWLLFKTVSLHAGEEQFIRDFDFSANQPRTQIVHGTKLEVVWTVLPSLILIVVAVPSFALLYSIDEVIDPAVTLKCVGHQWYWSYELSDYERTTGENINFDSYIVAEEDLQLGELRLLEVDNRVAMPIHTHIRVLVTATDVLHSWAVPALGIKMDACPGRLNQTSMFISRPGVFFGQCSEICGVNHGFMPIVVESMSLDKFLSFVSEQ